MADPKFDVVIPYQFYNLILTFVTILALLWGMVAIKRVYRMLRIRSAVLSDRLIHIRGLGSYLTYFDGATRSHMDAVVHTRQSMPPVAMEPLSVAAVVKDIEIKSDGFGNYSLGINIESTCKCKVVVLFDYNAPNFQQLVVQARQDVSGSVITDSKLFSAVTGFRAPVLGNNANIFPRFQRHEVCSFECLSDDVVPGSQSLRLSLTPTLVSFVQDKIVQPSSSDATSKLIIGVMLLPVSTSKKSAVANSHRGTVASRKHSNRVGAVSSDLETADALAIRTNEADMDDNASVKSSSDAGAGPDGFVSGRNPLTAGRRLVGSGGSGNGHVGASSPTAHGGYVNADTSEKYEENAESSSAQSVFAGVFMHNVNLPALRSNTGTSSAGMGTAPYELVVLDRDLNLYSSLEIFGLASSQSAASNSSSADTSAPTPSTQHRPAQSVSAAEDGTPVTATATAAPDAAAAQDISTEAAAAAVCCGGRFVREDCVVCLTDHKEVLLLPCRHLCVCESCLVFIDKCPVCRAAFEEYITIKPSGTPVPALSPALPVFSNVVRSSNDSQQQPSEDIVTPHMIVNI